MSNTRRFTPRMAIASALLCVATLTAPLGAQTSAELTQRVEGMKTSIKLTQARLAAMMSNQAQVMNDSIVVDGVTVLLPRTAFTEKDRAALRDGIADAQRTLNARFGAGASRLLDGETWSATYQEDRSQTHAFFVSGRDPVIRSGASLQSIPLQRDNVTQYVLRRAGTRLMERNAVLNAWAGGVFSFGADNANNYVARRQLATSRSSVARRCAAGVVGACRTILDTRAADEWFAPSDSAGPRTRAITPAVYATVVTVAMELGGARALNALATPIASDEPVTILATAAGVTPDSLLHAWSTRLDAAGRTNATPSLPFAASAFFWSGLLLLAASRRRPR